MISVLYWTNTLFWIGVVLHFVSDDLCTGPTHCFGLVQCYIFFCSSLKQQSTCRHVILLTHIILNLGQVQPVYDLSPQYCMLSKDTANINSTVFGLTQSGIEHKIYHTRGDYPGLSSIGKYFNVQDIQGLTPGEVQDSKICDTRGKDLNRIGRGLSESNTI